LGGIFLSSTPLADLFRRRFSTMMATVEQPTVPDEIGRPNN